MSNQSSYLHSPEYCQDYRVFNALTFSHRRYFKIMARKAIYRFSTNKPFLSSESFASIVDTAILSARSLDSLSQKKITSSKSFFIKSDLLENFLEKTDGLLQKCILFMGHSDRNFDKAPVLPDVIRLCFAQNSSISDFSRFFTLPIGLENLSLGRSGLKKFFYWSESEPRTSNRVLVPPMSPTNPVRLKSILYCKTNKLFEVMTELMPETEYFDTVRKFRFVLCLEGNGYDNHRLWETLYQGNFPVLLRTKWSESLNFLNLPILYLNSLDEVSQELLASFVGSNVSYNPSKLEKLWIPYWKKIARYDSKAIDALFEKNL